MTWARLVCASTALRRPARLALATVAVVAVAGGARPAISKAAGVELQTFRPGATRCLGCISATKPDLTFVGFTQHSVTIKNQGLAAAGPFVLTLYRAGDFDVETVRFASFAPGETFTEHIDINDYRCGPIAIVDSEGTVDELDETNNTIQGNCVH